MNESERSYSGSVVAAVIFAVMVGGVAYRYWPSEERSIRRHLSNLAETLSLPYQESEAAQITRFAALNEYFAPDVQIELGGRQIGSRDALLGQLRQWKPPPGGVVVEFTDVTISLTSSDHAQLALTAKISMTDPATGKAALEQKPLDVSMIQLNGDWVISKVKSEK